MTVSQGKNFIRQICYVIKMDFLQVTHGSSPYPIRFHKMLKNSGVFPDMCHMQRANQAQIKRLVYISSPSHVWLMFLTAWHSKKTIPTLEVFQSAGWLQFLWSVNKKCVNTAKLPLKKKKSISSTLMFPFHFFFLLYRSIAALTGV